MTGSKWPMKWRGFPEFVKKHHKANLCCMINPHGWIYSSYLITVCETCLQYLSDRHDQEG